MAQEPSSKDLLEAVKQQESGGRRYDSSGKLLEGPMTKYGTAKGEMQVLDSTMKKPGYGVKPAQDDSPDERARVGRDLLAVFEKKYKDRDTALIAYNWGPGNTNKWLAAGADPAKLPKETRDYVSRINSMMGETKVAQVKPMEKAPTTSTPVSRRTASIPESVAPVLSSLGTNYQTALAASILAAQTSKDDEDDDLTQAERFAQYMEENKAPAEMPMVKTSLADIYSQPRIELVGFTEPAQPKKRTAKVALKMFKDGGAVYRAQGSPEGGEQLTPQQIEQIAQRQQDARAYNQQMLEAPTQADTYTGLAKGFTQNIVPNVVGIPVDLTTMALRPFGYKVEKPVLGSEWNKEKLTEYGLRPEPPPEGTNERNWYDVGNFASFFVNPAATTRGAVATGEKLAQKGAQAAETVKAGIELGVESTKKNAQTAKKMLDALKKPKEAPKTTRVEPTMGPPAPAPAPAPAPVLAEPAPAPVVQPEPLPAPPAEVAVPPEMLAQAAPVAPPMQANAEIIRPFVGRLDAFVDTIKNPMQLGQLKGQLKGKFRDYDIERVERAFAGMDDKTKLTPDQIKQALAGVHSPSKWISETLPPEPYKYHQSADNVWGAPLGTTNLYIEQPAEKMAAAKLLDEGKQNIAAFIENSSSAPTMKALEGARNLLSNPEIEKIAGPELVTRLRTNFDKVENNVKLLDNYQNELKQIQNGFISPSVYRTADGQAPYFTFQNEYMANKLEETRQQLIRQGQNRTTAYVAAHDLLWNRENGDAFYREASVYASKKIQEMAVERARSHGISVPNLSLIDWNNPDIRPLSPASIEFEQNVKDVLEPSIQTLHEAAKNVQRFMSNDVKELSQNLVSVAGYRGSHQKVADRPHPIGFTRFSEHQATIPGVGTVEGRHFHELQSDLSKEMRKQGTTYGSVEKDEAQIRKLRNQIEALRKDAQEKAIAMHENHSQGVIGAEEYTRQYGELLKTMEEKLKAPEKRFSILSARIRNKAPYSLEEPFAGFETNSDLRRQLLMKNAVQSAMKDGKRFATFPGAESAKPQLYVGKIYPNLKQVVKDMGGEKAGFEIRQIELPPDKDGNPVTAWGVVWSPEAAARIVEKGVPFAKGGMVERQVNTARYI